MSNQFSKSLFNDIYIQLVYIVIIEEFEKKKTVTDTSLKPETASLRFPPIIFRSYEPHNFTHRFHRSTFNRETHPWTSIPIHRRGRRRKEKKRGIDIRCEPSNALNGRPISILFGRHSSRSVGEAVSRGRVSRNKERGRFGALNISRRINSGNLRHKF